MSRFASFHDSDTHGRLFYTADVSALGFSDLRVEQAGEELLSLNADDLRAITLVLNECVAEKHAEHMASLEWLRKASGR